MDTSLCDKPKEGFKFIQKCVNLQRNSKRGVMQIGPKTIVMVLLKSLKLGNDSDQSE